MTQLTSGYWQSTYFPLDYWQSSYWQRYAAGTLFDNLVAYLEKQPSEAFVRPGFGQPGFTTECRLLIKNIEAFEK
jgi:hypothetical protein